MSEHLKECGRCGRVLKSEKSKRDGYGPVCLRKQKAEKAEVAASDKESQHEAT